MINIALCIKQVPTISQNAVDLETGLLKRENLTSTINASDLSALEAALQIKEKYIAQGLQAQVHAFSMGPKSAEKILNDSFALGIDEAYLINDKNFVGSDIISTSYTLFQAIQACENLLKIKYSIIICGNQTSDGGTAFVPIALSRQFDYPIIAYVDSIDFDNISDNSITALQIQDDFILKVKAKIPLVLSILPENFIPRFPTLKLKMQAKKKKVSVMQLADFADKNINNYGLKGARTKVIKSYSPTIIAKNDLLSADSLGNEKIAETILQIIDE